MVSLMWFRRDLRLLDHPALQAAAADGEVVPVFVLDDALLGPAGAPRRDFLFATLAELAVATGGTLRLLAGPPERAIPQAARATGAVAVHISSDHAPYGRQRDGRVGTALADLPLVATGSPYAVTPGRLRTATGGGFRIYTPFRRAWQEHGWRPPAVGPLPAFTDAGLGTLPLPVPALGGAVLPPAGEEAARDRWGRFLAGGLADYHQRRNRPEGSSGMSGYLKLGCLHPRTLLADLSASTQAAAARDDGAAAFRDELAWRDFYADVLWHRPASAREVLQPRLTGISYDTGPTADTRFAAWTEGRTGYPYVDAGMRQLRAQAWLPNRLRMVVASFLCKGLHLDWRRGARYFMQALLDGDLASNAHGWQWVAGTGTDPSPYHRVFNPVRQGRTHDPDGEYVRRWVPELRGIAGPAVHEPWRLPAGPPPGYPQRMVDHDLARVRALQRYADATTGQGVGSRES